MPGKLLECGKHCNPFTQWRGAPVEKTYGRKAILDFNGLAAFAQLAILRTLENEGWQGAWVDCIRRVYRTGYWESEPQKSLP